MNLVIIVTLLICGMALLVLELVVVPGTTIVGLGGLALTIWGFVRLYAEYDSTVASVVLVADIILWVVLIIYMMKRNTWRKLAQTNEIDSKVNEIKTVIQAGDKGKSITRLAPMGTALINGERVEVYTSTSFVDPNTDIVVEQVEGSKIRVKPI